MGEYLTIDSKNIKMWSYVPKSDVYSQCATHYKFLSSQFELPNSLCLLFYISKK